MKEVGPLKVGKVMRVIGPVVDVEFFTEELPATYNAIRIDKPDGTRLILEVGPIPGGECAALRGDVFHGRFGPGNGSRGHWRVHHHARGKGDARKGL